MQRREKFGVMRKARGGDLKWRSIAIFKNRKELVRLEHKTSYIWISSSKGFKYLEMCTLSYLYHWMEDANRNPFPYTFSSKTAY